MDLRKRRSQEKLQAALVQHLQERTIDEITIGELTRTAGVSRQTFYSNFDSKQSILLSRIEALFSRSRDKFESVLRSKTLQRDEIIVEGIRNLLLECNRERVMMRAAFEGRAGTRCHSLLKDHLKALISECVLPRTDYTLSNTRLGVVFDFCAGGLVGIIQGWILDEPDGKTAEIVVQQVALMISNGLDGLLVQNGVEILT